MVVVWSKREVKLKKKAYKDLCRDTPGTEWVIGPGALGGNTLGVI